MTPNILEIRNYLFAPDMLEHFIDYFEEHFIESQEALGMQILGQFRLENEPDHFVWMRGFSDMAARKDGLQAFYSSALWKKYRPFTADMMLEFDNVHLLHPIDDTDLTGGLSATDITSDLDAGTISPDTGRIVVDFYDALPGKRDALIQAFRSQAVAVYTQADVQVRGLYVAEMTPNDYPGLPVIQNEHEFVVITAYNNAVSCREKRARLTQQIQPGLADLLSKAPETLVLSPTLRSPLRYLRR